MQVELTSDEGKDIIGIHVKDGAIEAVKDAILDEIDRCDKVAAPPAPMPDFASGAF